MSIRRFYLLGALLAVSACGGGGGSAGGGGTPFDQFNGIEESAIAAGATETLPASGNAAYRGQLAVVPSTYDAVTLGDVMMTANFDDMTIEGAATDFRTYQKYGTPEESSQSNTGGYLLDGVMSGDGSIVMAVDGTVDVSELGFTLSEVISGRFYGDDADYMLLEGVKSGGSYDLEIGLRAERE